MIKTISILVATHKNYDFPSDSGYRPVQVGKAISNNKLPIDGDDTGDNISSLNRSFCEITGLYWMWKNTSADIYGLAHYRRYFSPFGTAVEIKGRKIASTRSISELLDTCDVVISKPRNYWIESIQTHYKNAHIESDLEVIRSVINSDHPEYIKSFNTVMKGSKLSLYNMFAMRAEEFNKYCTWLFDILFKAQIQIPYETYGPYQGRVFGFLAERLLNVWVDHNIPSHRIHYLKVTNVEGENLLQKFVGLLRRKFQGTKQD